MTWRGVAWRGVAFCPPVCSYGFSRWVLNCVQDDGAAAGSGSSTLSAARQSFAARQHGGLVPAAVARAAATEELAMALELAVDEISAMKQELQASREQVRCPCAARRTTSVSVSASVSVRVLTSACRCGCGVVRLRWRHEKHGS